MSEEAGDQPSQRFQQVRSLPLYIAKVKGWTKLYEIVESVLSKFPANVIETLSDITVYMTLKNSVKVYVDEEGLIEYEEEDDYVVGTPVETYAAWTVDAEKRLVEVEVSRKLFRAKRSVRERAVAEVLLNAYEVADSLREYNDPEFIGVCHKFGLIDLSVIEQLMELGFMVRDAEIEELVEMALEGMKEFDEEKIIDAIGVRGTKYEKQARRVIKRLRERYAREARKMWKKIKRKMKEGKSLREALDEVLKEDLREFEEW